MKKWGLIFGGIVLTGIVVGGIFVYNLYNKPHRDIATEIPAFTLTETELADMFGKAAQPSDQKLKDAVLALSGTPAKTEESGGTCHLTFDKGGDYIISVSLDSSEHKRPQAGTETALKGLYVGFVEGDTGFGIPGEIKIKNGFIR